MAAGRFEDLSRHVERMTMMSLSQHKVKPNTCLSVILSSPLYTPTPVLSCQHSSSKLTISCVVSFYHDFICKHAKKNLEDFVFVAQVMLEKHEEQMLIAHRRIEEEKRNVVALQQQLDSKENEATRSDCWYFSELLYPAV
eukprot:745808-Hanusia_phi.AAC.3